MKKKLIYGLALIGLITMAAGLFSYSPAPATSGCVGGSYYNGNVGNPPFPIYTGKIDTFVTTGTDTLKVAIGCKPTSITFSNAILKCAGTPTVTVAMYASADGGNTYASTPITTYTVSPTSLTVPVVNTYIVNSTYGGNPYTNYMWVATGSASSTSDWQGTVLIR